MPEWTSRRVVTALGIGAAALLGVVLVLILMLPRPPSPRVGAAALLGDEVRDGLLDASQLQQLIGETLSGTPQESVTGGVPEMDDTTPAGACAGVIQVAPQVVYRDLDVRGFARSTWVPLVGARSDDAAPQPKVMFVKESVVALPSAEEAQRVFQRFTEQWQACDGRPVDHGRSSDEPARLPGTEMHIRDVHADDTVLSASIVLDAMPEAPDVRAIGLQDNCIVGVLLPFTRIQDPAAIPDPQEAAVQIVRALQDRVADRLG